VSVPEEEADHDGATVFATSLSMGHRGADAHHNPAGLIMASMCVHQHPNPPEAQQCRICGQPVVPGSARLVNQPVLAVLKPSSGQPVDVDRPVLVGRSPSADRVARDQLPKLMTVPSPSHDISRTHLRISPDGWSLVATDEYSTNGTILVRPGQTPERERLTPGESTPLEPGFVLDLGDGVTIRIEPPQS